MSTKRTLEERIVATQKEAEQKQSRLKTLLQKQKSEERKARNHRLCKRGGIIEKLLPDLIRLTDEQFDDFVEKTLLSGYAEKVIRGLVSVDPIDADVGTDTANAGGVAGKMPTGTEHANVNTSPKATEIQRQAG